MKPLNLPRLSSALTICLQFVATGLTLAQEQTNYATVTIAAIALVQSEPIETNKPIVTIPPPEKRIVTTATILQQLAEDEFFAHRYDSTDFPPGAKLVMVDGDNFQVLDQNNQLLVDVSNIMHIEGDADGASIYSGRVSKASNVPAPDLRVSGRLRISFDNLAIRGQQGLKFYLEGIFTQNYVFKPNPRPGLFDFSFTSSINQAMGIGRYKGSALLINGRVSVKGKGVTTGFF